MTVSSYLDYIASCARLTKDEHDSIRNSISVLSQRLVRSFKDEFSDLIIFGSYKRDTILPRKMDEGSDVDYMVVFKDGSLRPQSYLDKLKRFVEGSYTRSEIKQSSPTIQLSLNHICFELVPATKNYLYGFYIPNKQYGTDSWMQTDPYGLNQKLVQKNQTHGDQIISLVRLVKYWNAINGKVFSSFEIETKIIDFQFSSYGAWGYPDLETYFFQFMPTLQVGWADPQWKQQKIQRLKTKLAEVQGQKSFSQQSAEAALRDLLPDPNASSALGMLFRNYMS